MRVAIYDRVEPPVPTELPLRLNETCSYRAAILLLALAVPAVLAVGVASLTLLIEALFAPAARAIVAQRPALGLEILAALVFWLYLLALPIRRLVSRLTMTRTVEIGEGTVRVTEGGTFRAWSWSEPLSGFAGVAHHVRASLAGTRHELILVHPEKGKSVLLSLAAKMSPGEAERVAALLGQAVISSSALYRFPARLSRLALPTWRHAAATSTLAART